jgi:glycine/D-amino acid oxidase-like deaminating enzyme
MKRRRFLMTSGGLMLSAGAGLLHAASRLKVGIIGGGIIGASIAFHLAEAGAEVIVFEKNQPAKGATEKSFAWVNGFTNDPHYRSVRLKSLFAYREIDSRLRLGITWGGYLTWAQGGADLATIRSDLSDFATTPHPLRRVDAVEFARLSPLTTPGPFELATFSSIDGQLDPVWVTHRFLDAAKNHGAKVIYPCEVTAPIVRGSRLRGVQTSRGEFRLDRLIVAGGTETARLAGLFNFKLPMKHDPGVLVHTMPVPDVTKIIHGGPNMLSFKQMSNGCLVGTDATSPPDIPAHAGIRTGAADFPEPIRAMHGERIIARIATVLPAARNATYNKLTLGYRPVPLDGLPVVGGLPDIPDVYVAVMHSGVTLAPIMGRYVARELIEGASVADLAPYRPTRFAAATATTRDLETAVAPTRVT